MIENIIELLERLNLPTNIASIVITIILCLSILLSVLKALWAVLKHFAFIHNKRKLNRELDPAYYTDRDVDDATRYYIPTKYQNVSPSEDDEPGRKYIATAKNKLIPLLINDAFKRSEADNKFYLILADSGMGKTTFMINLLLAYKNKSHWMFSKPKNDIKLFPLGADDVLAKVSNLDNKPNTILLLDALDEDINAVKDYRQRIAEIVKIAKEFKCLVLTCRTQFFPTEHEEPQRTGYFTYGADNKEYKFQKLYLSVFSDKDVKKYLKKIYSLFNPFKWAEYRRALNIIEKSPNLVVRPMLLSKIRDLVRTEREYNDTYEIYEELISHWLDREASKPDIIQKYGSSVYKGILEKFSQSLAVDLYNKRDIRGGYYISVKDDSFSDGKLSLNEYEALNFSDVEMKSKSLLNRTADGKYKFAHKTFFEYFLVNEIVENNDLFLSFDFSGMDFCKKLIKEKTIDYLTIREACFICNNKLKITKRENILDSTCKTIVINGLIDFNLNLLKVFDINGIVIYPSVYLSNRSFGALKLIYYLVVNFDKGSIFTHKIDDFLPESFTTYISYSPRIAKILLAIFYDNSDMFFLLLPSYFDEKLITDIKFIKARIESWSRLHSIYLPESITEFSIPKERYTSGVEKKHLIEDIQFLLRDPRVCEEISDYIETMEQLQNKYPRFQIIY